MVLVAYRPINTLVLASASSSLNFGVEPLQFHASVLDAELPATPIFSLEGALDVYFTSPAPVYSLLGARASSPLLTQARRLRSQGTGSEFTKQTASRAKRCRRRSGMPATMVSQKKAFHS